MYDRNSSNLIAEFLSASLNKAVTSSDSISSSNSEASFKNPKPLFGQPSLLKFQDCAELLKNGYNKSGIYTIWPRSRVAHCSLDVYCDMDTSGGGWMVIQRRGKFGGPMNAFNQNWESYKDGFGTLNEEFWLGNDNIHALTNQGHYTVRFDLQQQNKGRAYALYDKFWIDNEDQKYKLHISGYSGDAVAQNVKYLCKKSHGIPSSRAAAVAKFRLLTGHDCLCAHLFRFNLVTSPICVLCDTGQDMTAAHLDECSALNDLNCIVKRYLIRTRIIKRSHKFSLGLRSGLFPGQYNNDI
ncbi:techylectin-5A [Trichonephila clavipes]|nr:techylectin-5A [Trichonephila clavipes]